MDRPPTESPLALGPDSPNWRATVPYLLAGGAYVALGVWDPRVLLSWAEGIIFVSMAVWAIPAFIRRRRS